MSFPVAVQSAAFYFLACTPCTQIRHRQKAAQRAKKEREEKARVVAEQPHLYQHPDPFNTNPYWAEEIQIGPSLPKKGKAGSSSKNTSQRGLTAVSRDGAASVATTSQLFTSPGGRPSTTTSPTNTSRIGSGPTIVGEEDMTNGTLSKTASVSTADDWNLKRYQREDEELWGTWTGHKLMDAIKQAGTTAGRFVESKLGLEREVTEEDRHNFYFSPRNPPVNDYHPPVVSSKPLHKDGLRWMLQPPPPAKVMEGKVPVSRTASMMSAGSRRTTTTMGSLSRQVGERGLEARLRSGESPFDNDLYSTSSLNRTRPRAATKSTTRTKSRRTARSNSLSTDEGDSSEGPAQRIRRPSYRATATPDIESEDDEGEYIPKSLDIFNKPSASGPNAGHAIPKTRLSTILSSETTTVTVNTSAENIAAAIPRQTSNLAPSLQDTSTPSTSVTSTPTLIEDRNNNSSQRQKNQRQDIANGIDKKLIAMAALSTA